MTAQLANRLRQARHRRFVGRDAEIELFRTALQHEIPDFAVLHLHGPGGVGKTTLLREFARIAQEANRAHLFLDCRHLDPSPPGFLTALQNALNLSPEQSALDAIAKISPLVLLIDTYELAAPLDNWLREEFLPKLSERTLIVIAGRQAPPVAWRNDGGWNELTRIVSLRNLHPDESAAFLRNRGLSGQEITRVLQVTYGHPLALSLAADLFAQSKDASAFDLKQDPDTLRLLLERFVADVTNPIFRQALEICAHAYNTDEALLAHCLGEEQSYAAFQWLRALSFIEQGPFGLFPHDLARDVLEAELRWRNLKRFREVHFQVRNYIIRQIQESSSAAQQFAIFALLFLHRNNPFMRPFYEWQSFGQFYIERAQEADLPQIDQMIRRHQGEESLAVARYWRAKPQSTFYVFRASGGAIAGFCYMIDISQATVEDQQTDPAVAAAVAHLRANPPRREGGTIIYFRNWMDADHYQNSPSIFNMGAMVSLRVYFGTPNLAYTLIAQANSSHLESMFAYLRTPLAKDAAFTIDGQHFGVFVHDWSAEPVLEWINIMGERELLDEIVALETLSAPSQPVVLSEPEFAEAVRQALKDVRRPDLLAQSPLLRSRCVADHSEQSPTAATLQSLLREGADTLTANPRTQKLHRVLWHTYFDPAPTQEEAAELLDLPFSTYRYQLGKGVEHLIRWLWQRELYGKEGATLTF